MYRIEKKEQLVALTSPVRQEIVDALSAGGPGTIAEIAALLGRPADGLYYHVRQLQAVGLLVEAGRRRAGKRFETIYDLPDPDMRVRYDLDNPQSTETLTRAVSAMLRLSDRDFCAGTELPNAVGEGTGRNLWSGRTKAWLTEKQVRQVREHVEAILDITRSTGRKGRGSLHAFSWVLTPVDPRTRTEKQTEKPSCE